MSDHELPGGFANTNAASSGPPLQIVYCVLCVAERETLHIFSTAERAQAFIDKDVGRAHVVYDYVVDHPERFEGVAQ